MKKDLILALFIGALIGFSATFAYWYYTKNKTTPTGMATNPTPTISPVPSSTSQLSPTPIKEPTLTLTSPEKYALSSKENISVEGTTDPANTVVVSTSQESVFLLPDSDGKFSTTVTLEGGVNQLVISSIAPDGQTNDQTIYVTYSTAKF